MRRATMLVLAGILACGIDDQGPEPGSAGRYVLRTINGSPPPAIITASSTHELQILSGVLNLYANGTCVDSTELRRTDQAGVLEVVDVSVGSYVRAGEQINFSSVRQENYSMSVTEASLHQQLAGSVLVYRK
jgi:hypothetical protein